MYTLLYLFNFNDYILRLYGILIAYGYVTNIIIVSVFSINCYEVCDNVVH